MSHPNPMHDPESVHSEDELADAFDLYHLDILVHRYPEAARDLVASSTQPTASEQKIADAEAARTEERLA